MYTNNVPSNFFMSESIWFDKHKYDEAERLFFETKAKEQNTKGFIVGNNPEVKSPVESVKTSAHNKSSTAKVPNKIISANENSNEDLSGKGDLNKGHTIVQHKDDRVTPRINSVCDKIDEVRHRIRKYVDELESQKVQEPSIYGSSEVANDDPPKAFCYSIAQQLKVLCDENTKLQESVNYLLQRVDVLESALKSIPSIRTQLNAQLENLSHSKQGITPSMNGDYSQ